MKTTAKDTQKPMRKESELIKNKLLEKGVEGKREKILTQIDTLCVASHKAAKECKCERFFQLLARVPHRPDDIQWKVKSGSHP